MKQQVCERPSLPALRAAHCGVLSNVVGIVGLPVLVVGNDAAEAISSIPGTISRTDRNAPEYEGSYRDFNINYYQASMNLSGGISGSPAVDVDGSAVGMVSGGLLGGEAICYLLPLHSVRKALECLRKGRHVPRGDIQCLFLSTPFHECRRLGLRSDWEERFRKEFTDAGGLMVADTILSSGPASGKIMVGDILLEINDSLILHFADLENLLDANIGKMTEVRLLRDSQVITVCIDVVNLHKSTPKRLAAVGGLFCHDLSYVQAMKYGVPHAGVHIAESAEPSIIGDGGPGWIIQKMGDCFIETLTDFLRALHTTQRGQRVKVTYAHLESLYKRRTDVLTLDAPCGIAVAALDDRTGIWRESTSFLLPPAQRVSPAWPIRKIGPACTDVRLTNIIPALVHVESRAYLYLDGFPAMRRQGMGVVVDSKAGLVAVSRMVIPHKACHITVTLGSHTIVEGQCLFWHPRQCYVVVKYDASLAPEDITSVKLSKRRADRGENVVFMRFTQPDRILHGDVRVGTVTITGPTIVKESSSARYHPINADFVSIDAPAGSRGSNGVLVASDGSVLAIWLPFFGGITTPGLLEMVSKLQVGTTPESYILPVEFEAVPAAVARRMGVPHGVIDKVVEGSGHHAHIYIVKKRTCGLDSGSNPLLEGDVIVSMDRKLCTNWADFDVTCSRKIETVIMRKGLAKSVQLQGVRVDDLETSRCVEFCGARIQRPHLAVRHSLDELPSEVYVSHVVSGSPADHYGLPAESFITMANGKAVDDIDSFVNFVTELSSGDQINRNFTLTITTLMGSVVKIGMRENKVYFPPIEWTIEGIGSCARRLGGTGEEPPQPRA